ncbi:MAG: DndE family protein [Dongiaceae bacterium]
MPLSVIEISNAQYRTTRSADERCGDLLKKLGYKVRYLAARLAIARSLSRPEPPSSSEVENDDEAGSPIRGQQLFGDGGDPAAWLALVTQRSGRADLTRKEFQALVSAHWRRGADLLTKDWEEANGSLSAFVTRLADLANLAVGDGGRPPTAAPDSPPLLAGSIVLPVGPIAEDAQTGEPVIFPLNAPGGSPHVAIMGGTNSGKTYCAITMLKRMRTFGSIPILAFDFKGDLSEKLAPAIGAEVVSPPRVPVPLHVLSIQGNDETSLREAAGRIRESVGRVKASKLSGVQSDALRESVLQVLRSQTRTGAPATLADVARALAAEYQRRSRNPDELTATLNELTQFVLFSAQMSLADFFARSWIIRLPQDGTAEVRRLVINLTLDALDRWLNALPDSPSTDGRRAVRHLCMLDEAHVILATKLPALGNLIRMSRSKGGVIMLISQSPDDFEGEDEAFLDNMGLTLAFNTQAKPGPTRTIFGAGASLADLAVGEALCRIRTEAKTRRVTVWRP